MEGRVLGSYIRLSQGGVCEFKISFEIFPYVISLQTVTPGTTIFPVNSRSQYEDVNFLENLLSCEWSIFCFYIQYGSLQGNGGVSINSLITPTAINTTMRKKNGTIYTDLKGTYHYLSDKTQQNIENTTSFVVQTSKNIVLQHDDEPDFITSNDTPRSLPKTSQYTRPFIDPLIVHTSKYKAIPNEQVTTPIDSKGNPRTILQSTQLIQHFFPKNESSTDIGGA